ncbi:MAG TPA: hypothetical protein VJU78_06300 [Chitinophagaceae bacterium]|nr:hypothetical protein [Chitinophagaceae bacterium]
MKKKILYALALICFLNLYASANQICTECPKKCCLNKATEVKKQPVKAKKVATTTIRPLNFYLFNI